MEQLRWLSSHELGSLEPNIQARTAFFSGITGIIDSHALMKHLETIALQSGVIFAYNCTVENIGRNHDVYTVSMLENSGESTTLETRLLINTAGVNAARIAAMGGINVEQADYSIRPCKGEYFKIANRHRGKINHLVYPAPTEISLGIHTVIDMAGEIKLGPNAFFVDEIDYLVDESHITEFYESASTFLQFLSQEDLSPDMAGKKIRQRVSRLYNYRRERSGVCGMD